jgi:hypothetical protein
VRICESGEGIAAKSVHVSQGLANDASVNAGAASIDAAGAKDKCPQ